MDPADWSPRSLDDLLAIDAICRLKHRYFRFLDQHRWDDMGGILTDDVVASYGGGAYAFEGRDEVLAFLDRGMGREDFLSSHRGHHPEIVLLGPDAATGTWAFEDEVVLGQWNLLIRGAGFYEDEYRRESDGQWRIARTGYRRSFEYVLPTSSLEGFNITASFWGTDGRSSLPAP